MNKNIPALASFAVLPCLSQRLGDDTDSEAEAFSEGAKLSGLADNDSGTEQAGSPPKCFLSFLKNGYY